MIIKVLIATNNQKKVDDYKRLLNFKNIVSLQEYGISEDVEETGSTYEENAMIKLEEVLKYVNEPSVLVIADDSGVSFDALNGLPNIYSHRFMSNVTNEERNQAVIDMANFTGKRDAQYVCALAYHITGTDVKNVTQGRLNCIVTENIETGRDFAYDSILRVDGHADNLDIMPMETRKLHSHRSNAVQSLLKELKEL